MWSAHLYQVTTGMIGPRVSFESLDWSIELNGTETINMRLRKSELPQTNLNYWLSPWWAGVVLLWNQTPVVAGPIITRPSESFDFVTIGCGGIRSVFTKRYLVDEFSNWDELAPNGVVSFSGWALGTIVKKVVKKAQMKPGGALPISYPLADMVANHERNYQGFNVSNLNVDDVLTKLSNVINGPDIMFKPRLLRDNQLTHDLWTGVEINPRIYQKHTPVWDTTPVNGSVSEMNVTTTGTYQTMRVFAIGSGQDKGTMIKVAFDDTYLGHQYPLLETSFNDGGSSENPAVIQDHAESNLDANNKALVEIQMTVRGDGDIPFGEFWPGDLIHVITQGWVGLPDGLNKMRLLSMTGDHTNNVKVSLQPEGKFT